MPVEQGVMQGLAGSIDRLGQAAGPILGGYLAHATVAAAGGNEFYVGVETGSDKIRWEMDKKFTNEDIDFQLEEFNKHGLRVFFLMLIGYVTETSDDHKETLKMFKRWQKYVATGTIQGIDLATGLQFLSHTPLERQIDQHGVYFLKNILMIVDLLV